MKYDNKSELKTVNKYHFKIVIPLIIAILIGMTGPLLANGLNLIMSQITPVYIMILTGTISILLFILAFYRAIISIIRQKISKQFLKTYLFVICITALIFVIYSIIFVVMNW